MSRFLLNYKQKIVPDMVRQFSYKNVFSVPKIEKIVLNMGVGQAAGDVKKAELALEDLKLIAGQKPVLTKARKSIAAFKLREGQPVGVKVTLRGARMYEFLDRLITIALPRVRDFRGISAKYFDGRGNFSFGMREHAVFPEIAHQAAERTMGLQVGIVTNARTDHEGRALLRLFGFPFSEK